MHRPTSVPSNSYAAPGRRGTGGHSVAAAVTASRRDPVWRRLFL